MASRVVPARFRRTLPVKSALAIALATCLAASAPAFAQSTAATLRGHVSGAGSGATVTATNTANGAVRRTQVAADGSYTLVGLEPGVYRVESGGSSQTVRLGVAATSTLDLGAGAAAPAASLGTVTVTALALPDVRTPEVGQIVDLHRIETTPQLTRNFLEFADTVPGMVFSQDQNGNTSLRGGAQNTSSTNVYIDGVGQKSYVKEGGVSGQFSSPGNPFSQLAIGEYKVITSNYKAEYGQISSAAVTAVTKSGTNEFHGEAFYRYTDNDMRAQTLGEALPGRDKVEEGPSKDYGFAIGGPIVKDRAHFFFSYEAKRFDIPATVVPGVDLPPGTLPASIEAQYGPISKAFEEDLYFGKIDWEITADDHFEFSVQVRDEGKEDGIGGDSAIEHGITVINDDTRFAARWQHTADNWLNEVLLTHEDAKFSPSPILFGNGTIYTYRPQGDRTIIQAGGADPRGGQNKGQKGWGIEDNFTWYNLGAADNHTVKMGVRYKQIDLHAEDALVGNPQFFYSVDGDNSVDATPWKAVFSKPVSGLGGLSQSADSNATQWGLFIQDDWEVNDKLIINLGVRWDYEQNPSYEDFVTPPNVVAALEGQDPNGPPGQTYAQSLANGGIDIHDYIGNGKNRDAFTGAWAPRLGFSYDLNDDERHVVHGGIGRAYDRDLYDYLQLEITKTAFPQATIYFEDPATGDCEGGPCVPFDPSLLDQDALEALVGVSNGGEVNMLNNKLDVPYSDQFSIGIANRIGDWQTDATLAHIRSYDGMVFTLGNRRPNGDFFQNGDAPWGNGVPGFGPLIIANNGIETRTTQVLLSAVKPYTPESGWSASIAYTFTDGEHNRNINEHYAFDSDSPTIEDFPFIESNAAARHRIVATGAWDGWWGIVFGGKLTLATGTPLNENVCGPPSAPVGVGYCIPQADRTGGYGRFLIGGPAWAYRSVDLQMTKEFDLWSGGTSAFVRMDILNLFDFQNRASYNFTTANGDLESRYSSTGDFTGVPRTVKVEVGVKF